MKLHAFDTNWYIYCTCVTIYDKMSTYYYYYYKYLH